MTTHIIDQKYEKNKMRNEIKTKYIFNYVFVIGLVILIINDHVLKSIFGNWITGKISDFAGILILPMFLKFIFPFNTKKAIMISVSFFIFWKSAFSQPFINYFNEIGIFKINRVIDYTDFIAFLVIPLTKYVLDNVKKFEIILNSHIMKKLATYSLLTISSISFIATSKEDDDYDERNQFPNNCCISDPVNTKLGIGRVYIPTAFTPDNDGINDFFQISTDSNILKINKFLVFDKYTGETLFLKNDISNIIPENGFDGKVSDRIVAKSFNYEITVTSKDNISEVFKGSVCSLPCDSSNPTINMYNFQDCTFSTQFDSTNGYNSDTDSEENPACYKL